MFYQLLVIFYVLIMHCYCITTYQPTLTNVNFILQKSSCEEPLSHTESDDQHQLKPVARSRTVSTSYVFC